MDITIDPKLPFHIIAVFCVAVIFLAFHIGYDKKERAVIKQQNRLWKEEQRKAPRARKRV